MAIFLNGKKYQMMTTKGGKLTRVSFPGQFINIPEANTLINVNGNIVTLGNITKGTSYSEIRVSWGDGSSSNFDNDISGVSHDYESAGSRVVSISNTVSGLKLCGSANADKFVSVSNMGSNVQDIRNGCFSGCSNLDFVQFGKGVKTIETGAFVSCTSLRYLSFKNKDFDDITNMSNYDSWFSDCPQVKLIFWEKGDESGCFAYQNESATIMVDDDGKVSVISDDDNNFIDKE